MLIILLFLTRKWSNSLSSVSFYQSPCTNKMIKDAASAAYFSACQKRATLVVSKWKGHCVRGGSLRNKSSAVYFHGHDALMPCVSLARSDACGCKGWGWGGIYGSCGRKIQSMCRCGFLRLGRHVMVSLTVLMIFYFFKRFFLIHCSLEFTHSSFFIFKNNLEYAVDESVNVRG